ncbi:PRTRC system protein B [Massilia sp. LjRoot122]|uniref:PRTRC system protein B n=1 Tax=Massilia sp. LjRoot122 TaxID=3342257 RepID=UPI003ECCC5EF
MTQSMNNFELQTGESAIVLSRAIMLYSRQGAQGSLGDFLYATQHKVENFGTEADPDFQIAAGQPVTREAIVAMFEQLAKQLTLNVDFLPENVLSISADHMVWWMPACERNVFFNTKELGKRAAKVPHPGLVFAVVKSNWYVFALTGSERPKLDTPLCHAPYFNVYDDGSICAGSAARPVGIATGAIPQWEAAFFDSEFTHINGGERKASHPRGEYALWKELLDGVYQQFPVEYLVPKESTIAGLMKAIRKLMERK